jgi:hypothetical protein
MIEAQGVSGVREFWRVLSPAESIKLAADESDERRFQKNSDELLVSRPERRSGLMNPLVDRISVDPNVCFGKP